MLVWDDKFTTGLENIDSHHKSLFRKINVLSEKIEKAVCLESIDYFNKSMGSYAKLHFDIEERCMKRYECPFAIKNKEAHLKFMQAFEGFQKRLETEGKSEALLKEVHNVAENWLTNHIIRIDTNLKDSVAEHEGS